MLLGISGTEDNCHLGGKTLDFGPFGFMEKYNPRYCAWLQKKRYGVTQSYLLHIFMFHSKPKRRRQKGQCSCHSCQHSRLFRLSTYLLPKKASQVVGLVVQRISVFTCSRKQPWPILEVLFDPCPHFREPWSWFPWMICNETQQRLGPRASKG